MPTERFACPSAQLIVSGSVGACDRDEGSDDLAVFLIGDSNNGCKFNLRVCGQSLFDLEGVNVLAAYQKALLVTVDLCAEPRVGITADDDILEATSDGAIALIIKGSFVAGLEPFDSFGIGNERFCGLLGVLPVPLGKLVPSHAKLASLAHRNDIALRINDLGTRMW
jgi:hypothetical protein